MSADCLFCKIVAGGIPVGKIHEDELSLSFADIHPQAPIHIVVIPKEHIASLAQSEEAQAALLGHLLIKTAEIARGAGLSDGYRVVINTGPDGGQTVDHLHLHLLGGRRMAWPPG